MATSKNFEVKNGLSVGGTERISSAGVGTFTDLNVTGTTTTIDTATLQVQDKNIVINYGTGDTSSTASGAGITIQDAVDASNDATLLWDASADEFDFSHTVTAPSLKSTGAATFDSTFTSTGLLLSENTGLYTTNASLSYYSATNGVYINGAGNTGWLRLNASGAQNSRTAIDLYGSSAGDYIKVRAANTDTMYFGAGGAGRVGIGTSNAAKPLHVYSSDNHPLRVESSDAYAGIEIKDTGSSTLPPLISALSDDLSIYTGHDSARPQVAKFDNDGKTYLKEIAALDASLEIGNGDEKQIFDGSGATIQFQTSDTERMRIGSTGKTSWSAGGIGTVATQSRDFTFYTEGGSNGIDIRSNDYRNILLGSGGSSGSAMDAGYIGVYKDGVMKIALNANGNNFIKGGHLFVDNGVGVATHTTMDANGHTWQTDTYNTITAGAVAIGSDSSNTSHMWWNVYDTGSKYGVSSGYGMDQYVVNSTGSYVWRFSDNASGAGSGVTLTNQFEMKRDGNVHIAQSESGARIYLGSQGGAFGVNASHNVRASSNLLMLNAGGSNAQFIVECNGSNRGSVTTSTSFVTSSDERIKKDIVDMDKGLAEILQLKPKKFKYNIGTVDQYGFIAQEVEEIMPDLITESVSTEDGVEITDFKSLSYNGIFSILVKAVQEQQGQIETLKQEVEELKGG